MMSTTKIRAVRTESRSASNSGNNDRSKAARESDQREVKVEESVNKGREDDA